jgi:hypothetical protein
MAGLGTGSGITSRFISHSSPARIKTAIGIMAQPAPSWKKVSAA